MSKPNKVHSDHHGKSLCGCQNFKNKRKKGGKRNVVPLSKEIGDVTCERCKGMHWTAKGEAIR